MTMHCIKDHNGRRGWDQRNSYPVGVTSKLKSGEDWSWLRGREEGEDLETHKDPEVMAHSGTPGRLCFVEGRINPLPSFL